MAEHGRLNVRVQMKRDTSANWTSEDPVLLHGERVCVDTSAGEVRFKTGDGVKKYTELPFDDEAVRNLVNSKQDALTFDTTPIANSTNPVTSGGVKAALDAKTAIIDVIELPTENIEEDVFYRLLTGTFVQSGIPYNSWTCYCVESLPEVGEPAANADLSLVIAYYNVTDKELSAYVDDALSDVFGVPVGWCPAAMLFEAVGAEYRGVITDIKDSLASGYFYLLLEYVIWQHKDGKWESMKIVCKAGEGAGAVVLAGIARATGRRSMAAGFGSLASGEDSVAFSEALASGGGAFAMGSGDTVASGSVSFAFGQGAVANGNCQFVHGRFNTPDAEGKYAHIVGNGTGYDEKRSNAHTLDWSGLGWFAGGLKVGGTGQDDENAQEVALKSEVENAVAQKSQVQIITWEEGD